MKAKVKSLGSVVDLSEYVYDEDGNEYTWDELELIDETNWQHYLIQAAIAAMQSYISDGERMALVSKKFDYDDKIISKFIAEGAVMYADALIAELQKKQD